MKEVFVHFGVLSNKKELVYAIQSEIFYSIQGSKADNDKVSLSYINIPIMVQRYIASSGFYIETGPQLGFLLSAKEKAAGIETNIKSQLKKIDFSWNVRLGYKFNSGIGINARYGLGLTTINSTGYDIRNAVISAGLYYIFGSKYE